MTISETILAFLDTKEARSIHTRKTYAVGLDYFTRYLSKRGVQFDDPTDTLTTALALGFNPWLAKQKWQKGKAGPVNLLSMRTRQLYIRALLSYYKFLVLTHFVSFNYSDYEGLATELGKATQYEPPPIKSKTPPDDVIDAIVAQAKRRPQFNKNVSEKERRRILLSWKRNLTIILCLRSGGMRIGELVKLRQRDRDYQYQEFSVIGKRDKQRLVRVSDEAWQAIDDYLKDRDGQVIDKDAPLFTRHDRNAKELAAITTRSAQRIIYKLALGAGVVLTAHQFRHYFATEYLAHTGDLALTQDTLGHANPATTRIYAQTSDERRRQAHTEIFNGDQDD